MTRIGLDQETHKTGIGLKSKWINKYDFKPRLLQSGIKQEEQ
jgi:hypothetical protein